MGIGEALLLGLLILAVLRVRGLFNALLGRFGLDSYTMDRFIFGRDQTAATPPEVTSRQQVDVWQASFQNIPLKFFGGGAEHNFDYYFTRSSDVAVSSIEEVVEWLLGCQYISDPEQFNKRDHWQHPVDFERTRRGDCEDFALWAWRKLVELGHDAEFMVGKWLHDERVGTHAWVFLRYDDEEYVFESTGRAPERIIKLHEDARDSYVPFAAIDNQLRKKVYRGLTHWVMTKM